MKNKLVMLSMIVFFFLFLIPGSLALNVPSNESVQAKELLNQVQKDISEMISKNISILRVNETYQEAIQLYSAQMALEEKGGRADYRLVIEYASKISLVEKTALEADDELRIFMKNYANAEKQANLSAMNEDYNQIILSFSEERFEDTLTLIKKGYDRISEIQSSQTAVNAVYSATSKTIKNFFIENGLKIAIIILVVFVLLLVFRSTLIKLRMRIKLNNLIMQKKAINGLIKEMQGSYFKAKKISETEYRIKLKNYEEFIRDIDRQVMVLKEEMFKRDKRRGSDKG
ncbi:MAG: hypothetical protein KKE50_03250 [Nanoarchaeota archaeon]|nr:hypothetical protein [Nanoarchaeota archaeon]